MKISLGQVLIVAAILVFLGAILLNQKNNELVELDYDILLVNKPYDIKLEVSKKISVDKPSKIKITVLENGRPLTFSQDKVVINGAVVSDDGTDFQQYFTLKDFNNIQDEGLEVNHTFLGGTYHFWIEINDLNTDDHHGENVDLAAKATIQLDQPKPAPSYNIKLEDQVDDNRIVRLDNADNIKAGKPIVMDFLLQDNLGNNLGLIPDFDHFYIVSSPMHDLYDQVHVDLEGDQLADGIATTENVIFPVPGFYTVWVALYEDGGSTEDKKIANAVHHATFLVEAK